MIEGLKGKGIEDSIGFLGKVGHSWNAIWVVSIVLRRNDGKGNWLFAQYLELGSLLMTEA